MEQERTLRNATRINWTDGVVAADELHQPIGEECEPEEDSQAGEGS
jgi:hypothetical protein